MKALFTLFIGMCCAGLLQAQLFYNQGATVYVESGAVLVVEGGFENDAAGTIDNNGTIEVHGDFTNAGIWDANDPNTIRFVGAANSNVTTGGALFHDVEIQKDAAGTVTLQDAMNITSNLNFAGDDNYVMLGANNIIFGTDASSTGDDGNQFIVTGGTGVVRRLGLANAESFNFAVGYDQTSYNPVQISANGGHTEDNFNVRAFADVQEEGDSGPVLTEEVVMAAWEINEDTPGGSNVDVTLKWAVADEGTNFDRDSCAVSKHDGTDWDLLFTDLDAAVADGPFWTRTRTGVTDFSIFAVGAEPLGNNIGLDVKVFLSGAFDGATRMDDDLRVGDYLPSTEPYSGLGFTHVGFGGGDVADPADFNQPADDDDIVDWVVLELRQSGTPTNVLATKEALVQRDGDVVAKDGASGLEFSGLLDGSYHVAVRHRNHLGVMSDAAIALSKAPSVVNFRDGVEVEYDLGMFNGFDYAGTAQKDLAMGAYRGMWPGDAGMDNKVKYQGETNDPNTVLTQVTSHPDNGSGSYSFEFGFGYFTGDIDLDGKIKYQGANNDPNVILTNVTAYPINVSGSYSFDAMIAQLPQ